MSAAIISVPWSNIGDFIIRYEDKLVEILHGKFWWPQRMFLLICALPTGGTSNSGRFNTDSVKPRTIYREQTIFSKQRHTLINSVPRTVLNLMTSGAATA